MFLIKNLRVYTIGKSSAVFSLRVPLCTTFPYEHDCRDLYNYRTNSLQSTLSYLPCNLLIASPGSLPVQVVRTRPGVLRPCHGVRSPVDAPLMTEPGWCHGRPACPVEVIVRVLSDATLLVIPSVALDIAREVVGYDG